MANNDQKKDSIKIADEVLKIIAGIAVSKVEGVDEMMGTSVVNNLAERIRKKDVTKGVSIERSEDDKVSLTINVTIRYGVKIHEVSKEVQKTIRDTIKSMTGFDVESVEVNVQGVNLDMDNV